MDVRLSVHVFFFIFFPLEKQMSIGWTLVFKWCTCNGATIRCHFEFEASGGLRMIFYSDFAVYCFGCY